MIQIPFIYSYCHYRNSNKQNEEGPGENGLVQALKYEENSRKPPY